MSTETDEFQPWDDDELDAMAGDSEPVLDPVQLNRRIAALGWLRSRLATFDYVAEKELTDITERIVRRRKPLAERAERLERIVEMSARAAWERDRTKTIELSAGSVKSKHGGVEYGWPEPDTDEWKALFAWVEREVPEAVEYPPQPPKPAPRLIKAEVLKAVKPFGIEATNDGQVAVNPDGPIVNHEGEVVAPGLVVRDKPRTFTVEPDTGGGLFG